MYRICKVEDIAPGEIIRWQGLWYWYYWDTSDRPGRHKGYVHDSCSFKATKEGRDYITFFPDGLFVGVNRK
jgi:hypothetical protein